MWCHTLTIEGPETYGTIAKKSVYADYAFWPLVGTLEQRFQKFINSLPEPAWSQFDGAAHLLHFVCSQLSGYVEYRHEDEPKEMTDAELEKYQYQLLTTILANVRVAMEKFNLRVTWTKTFFPDITVAAEVQPDGSVIISSNAPVRDAVVRHPGTSERGIPLKHMDGKWERATVQNNDRALYAAKEFRTADKIADTLLK